MDDDDEFAVLITRFFLVSFLPKKVQTDKIAAIEKSFSLGNSG